ncbi:hypothetical protein ABPG72_018212 [Tetrahymena utriculariae]
MITHNQTKYNFFANKQVISFHKELKEIEQEIKDQLKENQQEIRSLAILSQIEYKFNYSKQQGLHLIKQILQLSPQDLDARIDLILIQIEFRVGVKEDQQKLLQECFQLDPLYWRNFYVAGILYNSMLDEQQSRCILEQGLIHNPNNQWILSYLTQICSDKPSMHQITKDYLNQILKSDTYDSEILRYISYIYGSLKNEKESLFFLEKSLKLNPKSPQTLNNLGQLIRASIKDNIKCIEQCQKAIEINPRIVNAYYNMGLAYQNEQLYDKSLECYKNSIVGKKLKTPYQKLYALLKQQKKYQEAGYYIQKGMQLNPNEITIAYYYFDFLQKYFEFNTLRDNESFNEASNICLRLTNEEQNKYLYGYLTKVSNQQFF